MMSSGAGDLSCTTELHAESLRDEFSACIASARGRGFTDSNAARTPCPLRARLTRAPSHHVTYFATYTRARTCE